MVRKILDVSELEEKAKMDEDERVNYRERLKLFFDLLKHSTTLSTGSIVLMITFIHKVFKEPNYKELFVLGMVAFLISIISSLFSMFLVSGRITNQDLIGKEGLFILIAVFISAGAFVLGIISVLLFFSMNWL